MALKSVLDIQVNDAQFQQYYQKFQQYQASLAQMPTAWQQAGASAQGTVLTFEKMGALMLTQTEMLRRIAEHYGGVTLQTTKQETLWKRMTEHAKGFAGHIVTATRSILHWGTLTTGLTGLLGAGGLWGIHRLAAEGATAGRTAMGLGLSLGQMQAFRTSFGALLGDPMGFLHGLSEARADPSQRVALNQLRLSGEDPAAVLQRMMEVSQRWAPQMIGTMIRAFHWEQFGVGVEDVRGWQRMRPEERAEYLERYRSHLKDMELSREAQERLRKLNQTFEQSSTIIRTRFWDAVAHLAPGLERLTQAVTHIVEMLLSKTGHPIDVLSNYLERLAKELEGVTDTDINKWIKEWMDRGNQAVEWFKWFIRELGSIKSTVETKGWFYLLTHGPDEPSAKPKDPGVLEKAWEAEKKAEKSLLDPFRHLLPKWLGGEDVREGGVWGPNVAGPWSWKWTPKHLYSGPRAPNLLGPNAPGLGGEEQHGFNWPVPTEPAVQRGGNLSEGVLERGRVVMAALQRTFGLSAAQAAGVAGGFAQESGIGDPRMMQELHPIVPGSRGGFGWAQWTGKRRESFEAWSGQQGLDPRSPEANWGFFVHEVRTNPQFAEMMERLRRGDKLSPEEAGRQWYPFESGDDPRAKIGHRLEYARQLFEYYRQHGGNQAPPSLPRPTEEPGAAEALRRMIEQYRQQHPGYETPPIETPRRAAPPPAQTLQTSARLPIPKRRTPIVEIRNQTGGSAYIAASQLAI